MVKRVILILGIMSLNGCGHHLIGTYATNGWTPPTSLTFLSGNVVQMTIGGDTTQGTYQIEGQQVALTISGQSIVLNKDAAGCLEESDLGKLCKQ